MSSYPKTRTGAEQEQVAGTAIPDPYRWLEQATDEVAAWQAEQDRLVDEHLTGSSEQRAYGAAVLELVRRYADDRLPGLPRHAGGQWFRVVEPARVVVSDEPFGDGITVLDVPSAEPARAVTVAWISPSPDGAVVAVGICTDGSEQNTIRLVDTASGEQLPAPQQVLHDAWTGGAVWMPDSSGFFFVALTGSVHEFRQAVFRHRLGAPAPTEPERVPLPQGSPDYTIVQVSADGRWVVAAHGIMAPRPVALLDLADPEAGWKPFMSHGGPMVAGHVLGDEYLAVTDAGAPRGRVVAVPLHGEDPDDPAHWQEVIPESAAVLRGLRVVAGHLYLTELVDTYARIRLLAPDGQLSDVPLPGRGALGEPPFPLMALAEQGSRHEFLFAFSSLTASWSVHRHRPGSAVVEQLAAPAAELADAVVDDRWAVSADGTRVPYHTVRLPGAGPVPALITAYGGFNVPWSPWFPGPMAAFAAAGGVLVHAHLRGGAEFGRGWWEDGRLARKQNCYADLYAVAEDLVASQIAPPGGIGVTGGSNGGLLAAVAVTQRPELWSVAVPRVPMLDLMGALRDPYGAFAVRSEFGDPTDPDEVQRLLAFSPYHLVEHGRSYPAVLVDAGETDPRCPPWHARKWVARMQAAQGGPAPVLLRVRADSGHGWATPADIALVQNAEWIGFCMRHLGLKAGWR